MKFFKLGKLLLRCTASKTKILDLMIKNNLTYISLAEKEKFIEIIIFEKNFDTYRRIFEQRNIEYEEVKIKKSFAPYLRFSLIVGALFLILSVYLSTKFVWSIQIEGNETTGDEEILTQLEELGLSTGSYIPNIACELVQNSFLKNSSSISWMSINFNGSIATIKVKEKKKEDILEKVEYSNIVAKSDGQIISLIVMDGKKMINLNDVVKKGDLLISGVVESQAEGVRYVDSNGIIKAYVQKTIDIKIPLKQIETVKTGEAFTEKSLKIFNNIIFFSRKYGNQYTKCDRIELRNSICFFGLGNLPFEQITTKHYELEEREIIYTKAQAVDLAFAQLRTKLDLTLENAELVSKSIKTHFDGEAVYVTCYLVCIEDICEKVEFKVDS